MRDCTTWYPAARAWENGSKKAERRAIRYGLAAIAATTPAMPAIPTPVRSFHGNPAMNRIATNDAVTTTAMPKSGSFKISPT